MCLVTKLQYTDQKLVHSLACLRVSGDKTAVHRPEIGTFIGHFMCVWWQNCSTQARIGSVIGLFMCVWWQNCSTQCRNWYSHWPLYVCIVTKLLIHCTEIVVICLFICVHWQLCSRQCRNWYVHWPLYVCLVTNCCMYAVQKLVCSS